MTSFAVRFLAAASLAVPAVVVPVVAGVPAPAVAAGSQAPVVTQVVPVQGSTVGYTDVIINGRQFTKDSSVVIGGFTAPRVTVLSGHRLAVVAPTHGHGAKNVVVKTEYGTSRLSKASTFTYVHATLPGTWTSSRAALPANAGQDDDLRLAATSCPDVSTCYSVGRIRDDYDYANLPASQAPPSSGDRPVIRTRTGSSYSIVDAPLPADVDRSALYRAEIDSIDCPAVGSCAAVGRYPAGPSSTAEEGEIDHVMLLTLSDGVWHVQAAPTGSVVTSNDSVGFAARRPPAVSCGAPGICLVGVWLNFDPQNGTVGVLYRLSGSTWTGARPVVPSGAKADGVTNVSCPTATFCAAALESAPNSYVDVLNHNRLTATAVHAPKGTGQAKYDPDVVGLQCPAVQDCVAVVGNERENSIVTYFLRMIGSSLAGQASHLVPVPGGHDPDDPFHGYQTVTEFSDTTLVCPSSTTCFATDEVDAGSGTVIARLSSSTVHVFVMPSLTESGDSNALSDLACPSVTSCEAVGDGHDAAPAYITFADGVWTPGSVPPVADQPSPSQARFVDLACPAVGSCFADASYDWSKLTGSDGSNTVDGTSYTRSTDLDAVLTPN